MNEPARKLAADVRILAQDVEELVKATAAQSGERLNAARARVQAALAEAKDTVLVQGRSAVQVTDRYVHENPWPVVGVAAGIGVIVGILVSRR